jgi:hypothetical protein
LLTPRKRQETASGAQVPLVNLPAYPVVSEGSVSKFVSTNFAVYGIALFAIIGAGLVSTVKSQPNSSASDPSHRTTDPRQAMVATLAASRPNPSLGKQAQVFDRFVGTWDADFGFPHDDGRVTHKKGEILFGWVIDGYAIQDLWIGYPTDQQKERTIGTTLRFFDKAHNQWRIVFVNPQASYVVTTQGGLEGDRIVLRGVDTDGLQIRWTFSEMKPDSFHWQGEKSHNGGKTWKLEEDHHMKRRS